MIDLFDFLMPRSSASCWRAAWAHGQKTRGREGGEILELVIKGDPKEIAALVVEIQERREANRPEDLSSELLKGEAVHLSGEKVGRSFLAAE